MDDNGFEAMMEAAGFAPQGRQRADDALSVTFIKKPIRDEAQSAKEGRHVYRDVEMIEIKVPGEIDIQRRPVTDQDRRRFRAKYEQFLANEDQTTCDGMPLAEWTQMTASMREELGHYGVRTVEQLAAIPDTALQRMGPYMAIRQKARDWLLNSQGDALLAKLRNENEALSTRVSTLEKMLAAATQEIRASRGEAVPQPVAAPAVNMAEMVAAVMAAIEAQKPPRKKPGPKPKNGVTDPPKE